MEIDVSLGQDHLSGISILAVDDEEQVLRLVQHAFGDENKVFVAQTGAEGLTVLEEDAKRARVRTNGNECP